MVGENYDHKTICKHQGDTGNRRTEETRKAVEKLHKPKFAGNYEGPLCSTS